MTRKSFVGFVVLPILAFLAYFASLKFFPALCKGFLHTEHGAIEWGTASGFLIASGIAARLVWKTAGAVPTWCRVWYALFAVAGLFVAMEELSWGQKAFDWSSPAWFADHNSKSETNLHNMFNSKPSDYMRALATVGCPVFCVVLPIWVRVRRIGRQPGTPSFFLLPQGELATMAVLTLVLTEFNRIPSIKGMATWSGHLGELKELYWAVVASCYAGIMSRRLIQHGMGSSSSAPTATRPDPVRRQAA